MDAIAALEFIKTCLSVEQLDLFCKHGIQALSNVSFIPLNKKQIKWYVEHELELSDDDFDIYDLRQLVVDCEINMQEYNIAISEPKSRIFIFRTPTEQDFNLAKEVLVNLLTSFQYSNKFPPIEDVSYSLSGKQYIHIEIANIHERAWVGFDFNIN
jgi:hypothetical protein